jgi:hypothetical protein
MKTIASTALLSVATPSTEARIWFSGGSVVLSIVALGLLETIFDDVSEFHWVPFALVGLLPLVAIILGPRPLRILGLFVVAFIEFGAYAEHTRWERAKTIYIEDARLK